MSAKQCQNFRERLVATSRDARLDSSLEFMPRARHHADVGQIGSFTSAVAGQVIGIEQFVATRVTHLGDLLVQADLKRPQPQLVMPARQHRIESRPYWQISELQDS